MLVTPPKRRKLKRKKLIRPSKLVFLARLFISKHIKLKVEESDLEDISLQPETNVAEVGVLLEYPCLPWSSVKVDRDVGTLKGQTS